MQVVVRCLIYRVDKTINSSSYFSLAPAPTENVETMATWTTQLPCRVRSTDTLQLVLWYRRRENHPFYRSVTSHSFYFLLLSFFAGRGRRKSAYGGHWCFLLFGIYLWCLWYDLFLVILQLLGVWRQGLFCYVAHILLFICIVVIMKAHTLI